MTQISERLQRTTNKLGLTLADLKKPEWAYLVTGVVAGACHITTEESSKLEVK